ncbi:MAG: Spy/CpxP family protein refolding chaperone [Thermodesulfobacteriota bacterium]
MWNKLKKPLIALSVGLNIAFVAIWLVHAVPHLAPDRQTLKSVDSDRPDFLHRKIGVSAEQWQQIAPHLREFRQKSRDRRQTIGRLREQLMDLLAEPSVEEQAIREKQKEILANKRIMQDLVIELLLEEKKVLTADQQRELLSAIHQHCSCNEAGRKGRERLGPMLRNDGPISEKESDSQ